MDTKWYRRRGWMATWYVKWYRRRGWMATWYVLTALAVIAGAGVALWRVPWWMDAHHLNGTLTPAEATTVTGVRTALLAIGAGAAATVGIIYTHRTLHQNREGQVTDRYTKAISQIASDRPVEQLGGIYALERIMRDSKKDHTTIVEVLAAFVRQHAPATAPTAPSRLRSAHQRLRHRWPSKRDGAAQAAVPHPIEPVQAALTVLGRRPRDRMEPFGLDLSQTDLRGADLQGADLVGADLVGAHLERALLVGAHLERADLPGAHLVGAHLEGAHLVGAHLERADLEGAHLHGANLERADLHGANLERADLEDARALTVEQLVSARPGESTRLPAELAADGRVRARIAAVQQEGRVGNGGSDLR